MKGYIGKKWKRCKSVPRVGASIPMELEGAISAPWCVHQLGRCPHCIVWEFVCVCVCVQSFSRVQLFVTPYSPPGSSVHGILQARKLEWVAITSSRGSSQPRDQTCIFCDSCIGRLILHHWATWEAQILGTFHYVGMIDETTGHWWLNSLLSPSPLPGRLGFGAESSKHLIKSWPFWPPLSWSFLQVPSPVISLAHKRCSSL